MKAGNRRFWIRFLAALGLTMAAVAAAGIAGCGDLNREALRVALRELPKNEPLARHALVRETVPMRLDGRSIEVELAYVRVPAESDEDGAPVVLVHGTPDTMGSWNELLFGAGQLAGKAEFVLLEVPGHGLGGEAPSPCTFQVCADYVSSALAHLELEDVTLVGNSYGGEFCWRAALDRPVRIAGLVLIDSSGIARRPAEFLSEERAMRRLPFARLGYVLNSEERIRAALDPHFAAGADDGRVREVFLCCENANNWRAMVDLARDEDGGRQRELGSLRTPTLLIWGERDLAYPAERFGEAFASALPSARLEVIAGAGHYPHEEAAARVADLLMAFRGGLR